MENSTFVRVLRIIFFCACGIVTIGGLVLFAMVLIGTIIGGESGSAIIIAGQTKIVPIYEWIMGGGVLLGIISMYLSKTFAYRMEKRKKEDAEEKSAD